MTAAELRDIAVVCWQPNHCVPAYRCQVPPSKSTIRPQPVRRFRSVTFAIVAHSVAARERFRSSLLASGPRSPGATVSELSVKPSQAISDCRHSAARLCVVPNFCRITTRLLPLTGSILPTRLYRSAFHEPGQLRHFLLTVFGPSR